MYLARLFMGMILGLVTALIYVALGHSLVSGVVVYAVSGAAAILMPVLTEYIVDVIRSLKIKWAI